MRARIILMNVWSPCVWFLALAVAGAWVSDAQGACALGTCITVTPPTTSSGRPSGGGGPVYSGPSPEEERRQREQKDLREAADDANDRGADFYEKGDWEKAASYFKEALEYDPDNADIRSNLSRAQHKLQEARAAEAGRQLKSVERHSQQAQQLSNEAASEEARKGFDTGGKPAGNLGSSVVYGGGGGYKEPVVPAARRTPAIAALERQRDDAKKQLQVLEEKLKQLDPGKNPVAVAKAKQEKSTVERKTQYLNFRIGEELEKPAQVTPSNAAK